MPEESNAIAECCVPLCQECRTRLRDEYRAELVAAIRAEYEVPEFEEWGSFIFSEEAIEVIERYGNGPDSDKS